MNHITVYVTISPDNKTLSHSFERERREGILCHRQEEPEDEAEEEGKNRRTQGVLCFVHLWKSL